MVQRYFVNVVCHETCRLALKVRSFILIHVIEILVKFHKYEACEIQVSVFEKLHIRLNVRLERITVKNSFANTSIRVRERGNLACHAGYCVRRALSLWLK